LTPGGVGQFTARPIRIALVGVGQIATSRHLPAIQADPRFQLAALATKADVRSPPGVQVFDDHAVMLSAELSIDAVAICTPPAARYGIARDALRAGCHVLLEKPTTATMAEANHLPHVAEGTGLTLFATWHSRFNAAVTKAHELLGGRRVVRMDVQWREDVDRYHSGQDWIWRPGGFGVFDPGINALSIVTAILPDPLFVRGCKVLVQSGREMPIAASVQFDAPHGGDLAASFDWRPSPDVRTIAITTADKLELLLLDSGRRLIVDGKQVMAHGITEYPQIYDRFATLIIRNQSDYDVTPQCLVADALSLASRDLE
jgi:D-galactose 1-dehydrogenase